MQVPCYRMHIARLRPVQARSPMRSSLRSTRSSASIWKSPAGSEIIRVGDDRRPKSTRFMPAGRFVTKCSPTAAARSCLSFCPAICSACRRRCSTPRCYGIEALTDVELCVLPRKKVWALFGKMPGLAFDVAWLGSREESFVDENLTSVGRRTAAERVAALIITLYKRAKVFGMVGGREFRLSAHPAAHRRRARPVARPYQQNIGEASPHGHVQAAERHDDADQSAGAGARRPAFRRRNADAPA